LAWWQNSLKSAEVITFTLLAGGQSNIYFFGSRLPTNAIGGYSGDTVLKIDNQQCLESAIHGLARWTEVPEAVTTLPTWLKTPTTINAVILNYARATMIGKIL
jgi:hypothetical protein